MTFGNAKRRPRECSLASLSGGPSGYRQLERKYRAAAELTGYADGAVVSFDDCLGDGKSHARALDAVALIAAAIELVKDERLLEVVDARSVIRDAGDDPSSLLLGGYRNG